MAATQNCVWLNFNDILKTFFTSNGENSSVTLHHFPASLLRGRTLLIELTFLKYHRSEPSDISSGVIFFSFNI